VYSHAPPQAQALVLQLTDCYDNVVPCFPPGYQAFDTIAARFHEHLTFMLDCVGAAAASLSSNDILQARVSCLIPILSCFFVRVCHFRSRRCPCSM